VFDHNDVVFFLTAAVLDHNDVVFSLTAAAFFLNREESLHEAAENVLGAAVPDCAVEVRGHDVEEKRLVDSVKRRGG